MNFFNKDKLPETPKVLIHRVLDTPLQGPYPEGFEKAIFGMGCFWGAERIFWRLPGVFVTAVGYAGGTVENPSYQQVCRGKTGHAEVVLVVYDHKQITYGQLLATFWEEHNPTQGMRQGNDVGSQYRSIIITFSEEQHKAALASREAYQERLLAAGKSAITTEIVEEVPFYFGEDYHQQYLDANPRGYCGLQGTGVSCPVGTGV